MQKLVVFIVNSVGLFFLGILRSVSSRIGLAPRDDAQQIEQLPLPVSYVRYRRYIQVTAEWLDEYWPIISRWVRTWLDCLLPHNGDIEELAVQGSQLGFTDRSPHPIPATAVPPPPPPPPAHHED